MTQEMGDSAGWRLPGTAGRGPPSAAGGWPCPRGPARRRSPQGQGLLQAGRADPESTWTPSSLWNPPAMWETDHWVKPPAPIAIVKSESSHIKLQNSINNTSPFFPRKYMHVHTQTKSGKRCTKCQSTVVILPGEIPAVYHSALDSSNPVIYVMNKLLAKTQHVAILSPGLERRFPCYNPERYWARNNSCSFWTRSQSIQTVGGNVLVSRPLKHCCTCPQGSSTVWWAPSKLRCWWQYYGKKNSSPWMERINSPHVQTRLVSEKSNFHLYVKVNGLSESHHPKILQWPPSKMLILTHLFIYSCPTDTKRM